LKPFKSGGQKILTEAELNKAEQTLKKTQLEWKRRRKGCMEVVDTISESVEMNRKEFIVSALC